MQVPRTAIGKMGVCPKCGRSTRITKKNTSPHLGKAKKSSVHPQGGPSAPGDPTEEAKQLFGRAVDHFYAQRYAEALAIFDALVREYPGNPDIINARAQCEDVMRRPTLALPDSHADGSETDLTTDEIKRFVTDKLRYGGSEEIQMKAAELACRYFGLTQASAPAPVADKPEAPPVQESPEQVEDSAKEETEEDALPPNQVRIFPSEDAR